MAKKADYKIKDVYLIHNDENMYHYDSVSIERCYFEFISGLSIGSLERLKGNNEIFYYLSIELFSREFINIFKGFFDKEKDVRIFQVVHYSIFFKEEKRAFEEMERLNKIIGVKKCKK